MSQAKQLTPLKPPRQKVLNDALVDLLNALRDGDGRAVTRPMVDSIMRKFTFKKGVPLSQGDKLLSPRWRESARMGRGPSTHPFGDIELNTMHRKQYEVFKALTRFSVSWNNAHPLDRQQIQAGLEKSIVEHLQRHNYAVGPLTKPLKSPSGKVLLFGQTDSPIVNGNPKKPLTTAQYDVVRALLKAGPNGLTKDTLVTKSRHGGALRTLKDLAAKDADWRRAISLAKVTGGGYRIL